MFQSNMTMNAIITLVKLFNKCEIYIITFISKTMMNYHNYI